MKTLTLTSANFDDGGSAEMRKQGVEDFLPPCGRYVGKADLRNWDGHLAIRDVRDKLVFLDPVIITGDLRIESDVEVEFGSGLTVGGTLISQGSVCTGGPLVVVGDLRVQDTLFARGTVRICSNATVGNHLGVYERAEFVGDLIVGRELCSDGSIVVMGELTVAGVCAREKLERRLAQDDNLIRRSRLKSPAVRGTSVDLNGKKNALSAATSSNGAKTKTLPSSDRPVDALRPSRS